VVNILDRETPRWIQMPKKNPADAGLITTEEVRERSKQTRPIRREKIKHNMRHILLKRLFFADQRKSVTTQDSQNLVEPDGARFWPLRTGFAPDECEFLLIFCLGILMAAIDLATTERVPIPCYHVNTRPR
jgi:hypothetical protein